jgi:hypothetical protein
MKEISCKCPHSHDIYLKASEYVFHSNRIEILSGDVFTNSDTVERLSRKSAYALNSICDQIENLPEECINCFFEAVKRFKDE